ncbi:MAG TPA: sigma-70 family RNA polymerase sigma factor [Lacipirellulaceae bacterium]|nr:sigma-70 family RNA polymerase sigma factor [Lacipirellulaceae bacterium]HMP05870.1 sigma-70 family RNA polymerase sigma factor [Lacipirellulaceae bacterium]
MSAILEEPFSPAAAATNELVIAAQQGDSDAFGELVARFEQMVQAVCWQRLRNHAEAQEAAQEVFIKALQKLHQLNEPAAFAGWLRAIAVRQAINRSVRRPPAASLEPHALESVGGDEVGPLGSLLARERADRLHEGLDRLASLDRSTLVAFYLEGQSLNEMSDEFAAPIGTIKRRLHVARKRLAKELECLQAV